jgi:signal peptidase II
MSFVAEFLIKKNLLPMSTAKKSVLLILLVLLVDQATKIYIKTHFALGDHVDIFSWFQIYFIENNGMAFGIELLGKLFLTAFRIGAVVLLVLYIRSLIKRNFRTGYILTISLLLAGAAGNIFDSVFYGVLFSDSYGKVATFLPPEGGYAPLFYGKVVDMLYFPLIKNAAGETIFFRPVFNVADAAITISVFIILLFYRKELNASFEKKEKSNVAEQPK